MKDRNANMPTMITLAEGDASVTFIHFWRDLKWKFSNVNKKTSLQDQDDLACCPPPLSTSFRCWCTLRLFYSSYCLFNSSFTTYTSQTSQLCHLTQSLTRSTVFMKGITLINPTSIQNPTYKNPEHPGWKNVLA